MFDLIHQYAGQPGNLRLALWYMYLVAAVTLPVHHLRPILKYLRGRGGIGNACRHDDLGMLDRHALRDLGLDRSEIGSYMAEAAGLASRTRRRVRGGDSGCT